MTKYGTPITKVGYSLKTYKNLLIILTEKDHMKSVHDIADFNVSITTQPHQTEAAIALFLHYFFEGRELSISFPNARSKIVPKNF